MEIISPSSRAIDRVRKSATYATFGVAEYLIVDPDNESILAQTLIDGKYQPIDSDGDLVASRSVQGLTIDPREVFAPPSWRRTTTA